MGWQSGCRGKAQGWANLCCCWSSWVPEGTRGKLMCSETSVEFAACKKMFCLVLETMMEHKAISVIYWQILILIAISLCLKSNPGIILLKEMIRFDKWVLRQKYSFLKPALISFVFHTQRKQKFRNINQCGLLAARVMGSGTSGPPPSTPRLAVPETRDLPCWAPPPHPPL